jgi:hypothetical protein
MGLIKPKMKTKRIQMRLTLSQALLDEVKAYCTWAHIDKVDEFIEQAMLFVFNKDRDWKAFKQHHPIKEHLPAED